MIPKSKGLIGIIAIIVIIVVFGPMLRPATIGAYTPHLISVQGTDFGRTTVDLNIVKEDIYETGQTVSFTVDILTDGTYNANYALRLDSVSILVSDGLSIYTAAVYMPYAVLTVIDDGNVQSMVTSVDVSFTLAGSLTGDTFDLLIYTEYSARTLFYTALASNPHHVYQATPFAQLLEVIGDPDDPSNNVDNDALPDDWEILYFGGLGEIGTGDYDSDGYTNYDEYIAGTDPTVFNEGGDTVAPDDTVGPADSGLSVHVTNNEGDSIYNAVVSTNTGVTETTSGSGIVLLNVPDGSHTITVTHAQYYTEITSATAPGSITVPITFNDGSPPPPPLDPADDTDGDGMDDAWEILYFGNLSQPANLDYDDDGSTNLQEFLAGTDPTVNPFAYLWTTYGYMAALSGIIAAAVIFAVVPAPPKIKGFIAIAVAIGGFILAHFINTGVI